MQCTPKPNPGCGGSLPTLEAAVNECDDINDAPDVAWEAFCEEALDRYVAKDDGPRGPFLNDCAKIFENAKADLIEAALKRSSITKN